MVDLLMVDLLALDLQEEVVKQSWLNQISKGKERPNLVRWREELVAITKDSSEDYEDATLSVELMRMRCDVCYHEKAVRRHSRSGLRVWALVDYWLIVRKRVLECQLRVHEWRADRPHGHPPQVGEMCE